MKFLLFCLLLFFSLNSYCQKEEEISILKKQIRLEENSIYFFCRGTTRKSALIAHKFNKTDTNITHVGIGFLENRSLLIYNVTDNGNNRSALLVDSLTSFILSPDVYYLGIWKMRTGLKEYENIVNTCKEYEKRKIYFDASFLISNDDTLYCSEFCALVLEKGNKKFRFKPRSLKLNNPLYESLLDRKELIYYPVDFFEADKHFTKVFGYRFIN